MRRLASHVRAVTTALLAATVGVPAAAQRNQNAARAGWAGDDPPNLHRQATTAERAVMMTVAREIERILRQIPELEQPRGFEVQKQIFGGHLPFGEAGVLQYAFWLWFFAPSRAIAGHGMTCIEVMVNRIIGSDWDDQNMWDAAGRPLFVEYRIGEPVPGATVTHEGLRWDTPTADRRSGFVTFTTGGALPWIHLTREEYVRAMIYEAEGPGGDRETSVRKTLEKTTYERWLEEAPERKKIRDEAVAMAERLQGSAAAEELRKTLEQTEREVTESLRAQDEEERKRNQEFLAMPAQADQLRAELAAMTPAERASPAFVAVYGPLVAADHPAARRVLTPDPEFWRVRRSRAEVHAITVAFQAHGTCGRPAVQAALWQAYQTIDWAAFKRMVDASR